MAETLGSLCDKLTIVKLKQWHVDNDDKRRSLDAQLLQLQQEIDEYVAGAIAGTIPPERLTFEANKIYKKEGHALGAIAGTFGGVFSQLAEVNCELWHEQEKVYDFENVAPVDKNAVIKQLAVLNLKRNECIDKLNSMFHDFITGTQR
jgi:hypothetical protein